jgi:hypothetical protein
MAVLIGKWLFDGKMAVLGVFLIGKWLFWVFSYKKWLFFASFDRKMAVLWCFFLLGID